MILLKEFGQQAHGKHVDAHGGEGAFGIAGDASRVFRLLMEGHDPVAIIHRHHTERAGLLETDRQTRDGHFGAGVVVALQHRGIVHPVDVISGQNQDVLGAASFEQIQVLGGVPVPLYQDSPVRICGGTGVTYSSSSAL